MAENWQDQVPFYIAGLMSPAERAAFEAFLAGSPEAQQAVEEWRTIAHEVYREADSRASSLPSLSPQFRAQLNSQPRVSTNGHKHEPDLSQTVPSYKPTRVEYQPRPQAQAQLPNASQPQVIPYPEARRVPPSYTVRFVSAAAAAFLFACMGLIGIYALNQDDDPQSGSVDEETAEAVESLTPSLTTVPNMSICNLTPRSGEAVILYTSPDRTGTPDGEFEGSIEAHARTPNDWYAVGDSENPRFVLGTDVTATGRCDQLPVLGEATNASPQQGVTKQATSVLPPTVVASPTSQVQATPTAAFGEFLGVGGFPMITLEQVGEIPAGTRVNIGYTYFNGTETLYGISDNQMRGADARYSQLDYAPDVTPGPIPTPAYQIYIGMGGYPLETTESVGIIPAGSRVRISHAQINYDGWVYYIVPESEVGLEPARDSQLRVVIDYSNGTPTPTPTPQGGTDGEVITETMIVTVQEVFDTGFPVKTLIVTSDTRPIEFQVDVYTSAEVPPITTIAYADARTASFADLEEGMLLRVTGVGMGSIRAYDIIILEQTEN